MTTTIITTTIVTIHREDTSWMFSSCLLLVDTSSHPSSSLTFVSGSFVLRIFLPFARFFSRFLDSFLPWRWCFLWYTASFRHFTVASSLLIDHPMLPPPFSFTPLSLLFTCSTSTSRSGRPLKIQLPWTFPFRRAPFVKIAPPLFTTRKSWLAGRRTTPTSAPSRLIPTHLTTPPGGGRRALKLTLSYFYPTPFLQMSFLRKFGCSQFNHSREGLPI